MNSEDEKLIIRIRKENREKVSILRNKLQEELEQLCLEKGGHCFWSWQDVSYFNITSEYIQVESRVCCLCNKKEYKE